MGRFRSLLERIVLPVLRRRQYESIILRAYFSRTYGINVGMYSVYCFDRWRIAAGTTVGRYCSIAATARVIDANHPIRALSTHAYFYSREFGLVDQESVDAEAPVVEDDVWMGHNSIATPECKRIGRGAVIGAGAIVMRDVPRYGIMVGAPARLVGFRFPPDVVEAIEATEWWLLDKHELKRGLASVPEFLVSPSVESAHAFLKAVRYRNQPKTDTTAPNVSTRSHAAWAIASRLASRRKDARPVLPSHSA
jgi:virginiamycin A acetyltransferase